MKLHSWLATAALTLAFPLQAQTTLSARFDGGDVFSAAVLAVPGDAKRPLLQVVSGKPQVESGALVLGNARVTVGALSDDAGKIAESTGGSRPAGTLDLSKPYKVTIKLSAAEVITAGKDSFFLYVNNSTSRQADSPQGKSSLLARIAVSDLKIGDNVFESDVGDATSFLQLRAESGALVKIESISIGPR